MTGIATKSTAAMYVLGASTATSNAASYFDQYQSTFTVAVSIITCIGFIASIAVNLYFKYKSDKRAEEVHNKAMEPKDEKNN